jgi:hypothetical protein
MVATFCSGSAPAMKSSAPIRAATQAVVAGASPESSQLHLGKKIN